MTGSLRYGNGISRPSATGPLHSEVCLGIVLAEHESGRYRL